MQIGNEKKLKIECRANPAIGQPEHTLNFEQK